jgi:hypothetical protein
LAAREVTMMWFPIVRISGASSGRRPLRTELDWDTATLEFVIIASVSFLYFAWLEGGLRFPKVWSVWRLKVWSVWRRVPFGVRGRLRAVAVDVGDRLRAVAVVLLVGLLLLVIAALAERLVIR